MKRTTAVLLVIAALVLALVFVVGCPKKADSVISGPPMDGPDAAAAAVGASSPATGKLAELTANRTPVTSYEVEVEMSGEEMTADEMPGKMLVQIADGKQSRMKVEHAKGWVIMDSVEGFMVAFDADEGKAMKLPVQDKEDFEMANMPFRVDDIDADVDVLKTETLDGVECYVVESAPTGEEEKATIYVDKEFGLIRKMENKEGSMTLKFSRINELTDDDFKVPDGVKVEDMGEMMKGMEGAGGSD